MDSDLITLVVALVTAALLLGGVLVMIRLNRQHEDRNKTFPYARNLWDPEIRSKTTRRRTPTDTDASGRKP
jgi:hypothetical protein